MSVNLFPWRERLYKKQLCQFIFLIVIVILFSMFTVGVLYGLLIKRINQQGLDNQVAKEQLDKYQQGLKQQGITRKRLQIYQNYLERIDQIHQNNDKLFLSLKTLSEKIPSTIILQQLEANKTIKLIGYAEQHEDVQKFLNALKGEYLKVKLVQVNRKSNAHWQFTLIVYPQEQ